MPALENVKKKKVKPFGAKRINYFLKNGWCVLIAKVFEGRPIIQLQMTNFNDDVKAFLDAERKVMLGECGVTVDKDDVEGILKAIVSA